MGPQQPRGAYAIHLASFKEKSRTEVFKDKVGASGIETLVWAVVIPEKPKLYRGSAGRFDELEQTALFSRKLEQPAKIEAFVVRMPANLRYDVNW